MTRCLFPIMAGLGGCIPSSSSSSHSSSLVTSRRSRRSITNTSSSSPLRPRLPLRFSLMMSSRRIPRLMVPPTMDWAIRLQTVCMKQFYFWLSRLLLSTLACSYPLLSILIHSYPLSAFILLLYMLLYTFLYTFLYTSVHFFSYCYLDLALSWLTTDSSSSSSSSL